MNVARVIALVSLLVFADHLTKHYLVTQGGAAGHTSTTAWVFGGILLMAVLAPFTLRPGTRVPAILALSGAFANVLSDLAHGTVFNPIAVQTTEYLVAFNLADVYMVAAIATAVVLLATTTPRRQPA